MSLTKVFIINLILGLLASVAHVGALVLYIKGGPGSEPLNLSLISVLAIVDLILVLGALIALLGPPLSG